jgi:peptidoglycan/LPS O-acetylase OafA/YrhL
VAALIVLFHHLFSHFNPLFKTAFSGPMLKLFEFVSNLNVEAVIFFFFISGFSIALSIKDGQLPADWQRARIYLIRRINRIVPLYFMAIAFTLLLGIFSGKFGAIPQYSAGNLIGNLLFLQCSDSYKGNWFSPYGGNGPLWSLSFEMTYYMMLPALIYLLFKFFKTKLFSPKLQRILLVAAFVITLGCSAINKYVFIPYVAFGSLFLCWYAGFYAGILYVEKRIKFNTDYGLIFLIMGTFIFLNQSISSATIYKNSFGIEVAFVFLTVFILRNLFRSRFQKKAEYFFNFLFYRIGTGSYAIYLFHFPVIIFLKSCPSLGLFGLLLIFSLLILACITLEQAMKSVKIFSTHSLSKK